LLSQEVVNMDHVDVNDVNNVNENVNLNQPEQVLLSQEVLLVNVDVNNVKVEVPAVLAMLDMGNEINRYVNYVDGYVNIVDVNKNIERMCAR
jgi:hypothetical protein